MTFIDTSVLLYSLSTGTADVRKQEIAREILMREDIALSVLVLQEFHAQAVRDTRPGRLTDPEAQRFLREFSKYPVQEMTVPFLLATAESKQQFQISHWEASIIEAARAQKCDMVLSEELQHGQDYDGVRVINPFLEIEEPEKALAAAR